MTDICIRGRSPVTRPAGNKVVLLTGNSMLGNYSSLTRFKPANVYEIDPRDGQCYASDGGAIVGFDPGWYAWAPDGVSRESVAPYMAHLAVAAGHAPSISLINMAQGGTDCVDWQPGGGYWNRMRAGLATLAAQGIVPDLHIHYLGCWDALKGHSTAGVQGITNWFLLTCRGIMPNTKIKLAKRTYIAGVSPVSQGAVWAGMYQAAVDRSAQGQAVSAGPDDDIYGITDLVDGAHYTDNSRYYVCQQWVPHFAGI